MIDEAHSLGVLGSHGRGSAHAAAITPELLVGTLGKASGCAGAFVAGSSAAIAVVENRARSYVFSTAPPAAMAAVACAAIELVHAADDERQRLQEHATRLRAGLKELGYEVPAGNAQIIPCVVGEARRAVALSNALLERGVFVHGIRPPTVADGSARLRITPSAAHSSEQIAAALHAFAAVRTT
jgi:7-keto-8-aminopelargonate synthetase-like enzyme